MEVKIQLPGEEPFKPMHELRNDRELQSYLQNMPYPKRAKYLELQIKQSFKGKQRIKFANLINKTSQFHEKKEELCRLSSASIQHSREIVQLHKRVGRSFRTDQLELRIRSIVDAFRKCPRHKWPPPVLAYQQLSDQDIHFAQQNMEWDKSEFDLLKQVLEFVQSTKGQLGRQSDTKPVKLIKRPQKSPEQRPAELSKEERL